MSDKAAANGADGAMSPRPVRLTIGSWVADTFLVPIRYASPLKSVEYQALEWFACQAGLTLFRNDQASGGLQKPFVAFNGDLSVDNLLWDGAVERLSGQQERPQAPTFLTAAGWNPFPHLTVLPDPQIQPTSPDSFLMHTFVLADDHGVVRQSLKRLLTQESDLHLVGEAGDGLEVLRLVEQLEPDVLVTDLMMPGLNGLEVIRRVRQSSPDTRIIAVSVNSDDPYVEGAFTCGADAYVLKASCGKHLIPAVRAALGGERFISPPLSGSAT